MAEQQIAIEQSSQAPGQRDQSGKLDYEAVLESILSAQIKSCSCSDEEIVLEVQERLKLLRYAQRALEKTAVEVDKLKKDEKKLKHKVSELSQELKKLEDRIKELNGEVEEKDKLVSEGEEKVYAKDKSISELQVTVQTLTRKIQEIEGQYNLALQRLDESHRLLENEANRLKELQTQASHEDIKNLAEAEQIRSLSEKFRVLSEITNNQQQQIERIQKTITLHQEEKDRIVAEIERFTNDRDRLKSEVEFVKTDIRQIKGDIEIHLKEKHQLTVVIEGHVKDRDTLKEEIRRVSGDNIRLREESKGYFKINADLQEEIKKYKLKIVHDEDDLRLEVENGKRISEKLKYQDAKDLEDERKINSLLDKIDQAEKKEKACQSDRKKLEDQVKSLTTEVGTLQAKLKVLESSKSKKGGSSSSSSSSSSSDDDKKKKKL